jgi:signal transduction histidine kinase
VGRQSYVFIRRAYDVALPLLMGLFLMAVMLDEGERRDTDSLLILFGIILGAAQGIALRWRRTHPEVVMGIALAGGLYFQLVVPEIVIPFAGLFAAGSLAAVRPPRISLPALAALLGLAALNFATAPLGDTAFTMALCLFAWALGEAARYRRVALEEEARRAVADEQARIARELHDVIAHSVSVMVVQASAADDVFEERPDQARAALRSIEAAGREALAELRRLLAGVRPGGEDTRPQPGLDRLDELTEPLRAAGMTVAVRREGPARSLPAGVDLSAYRIVQEALTNTLRHAQASRAEVTVRYAPDAVELHVRDDGRGGAAGPRDGGQGIVGMRERAAMLGGTLEAGPAPEGGYRVDARLPVEP